MSSDRRDFLKFLLGGTALGVASSPLQTIIESAIFESAHQANAQTIEFNPERFYLNLTFPGAPPRWTYDLFLDPYGNGKNIMPNGGVATRFGGGSRYTEAIYQSAKIPGHNIHAPWMWSQDMPTSGGGWAPIHKLMQNMLLVQGINTQAPGHTNARLRVEQANGYSLAGYLSDSIKTPFNSVDLSSRAPFSSKKGLNAADLRLSTKDLISQLMIKFDSKDLEINKALNSDLKQAYQNTLDNLNYDASLRMPATVNVKKTHEGALELINSSIKSLEKVWNDKQSKYNKLVEDSFTDRNHFNGFMDKPIGGSVNKRGSDKKYQDRGRFNFAPDLRDMAHKDMNRNLPSVFAVAEFLAENKLAASMQGAITSMTNRFAYSAGAGLRNRGVTHDQHQVGIMIQTLSNALMYRAVSSCIYEFIQNRKTSGKGYSFENTVIRLNGEFNRSPRNDGSGADHGFQGQVSTIFSGKIAAPEILGRIYKDAHPRGIVGSRYAGSWGVGAPINIDSSGAVTLVPGHVISTIAALLGVPSPAFNNPSLVTVSGGKMKLKSKDFRLKVVS